MVFSSISFLFYFLPIVIIIYYLASTQLRNFILLVASLFFYAWGEPVYVLLMLFSILFNYLFGRWLFLADQADSTAKIIMKKKTILTLAVIVNLTLLGFFKYADFLVDNLNYVFKTNISPLNLPLPIGISFYTFQAMSYIIDLYRGQVGVQKSLVNFATYVSLFPQLIAGPIVRIKTVEEQLLYREKDVSMFASGVRKFIIGLAKKVLLANNIGLVWDGLSSANPEQMPILTAWLGIAAFTFQIYFDFSGYSDMAIGLGRMFGFEFNENFRYPYTSKSITEFWRRWHISLSTWFKEYVYIPLGGNQKGAGKQLRNILIVWGLTGLWHGASWNFAVWGLYFAILLIIEKQFLGKWLVRMPAGVCHIYVMLLVMVSWVIFSFDNIADGGRYFFCMIGGYGTGFIDQHTLYLVSSNLILYLILIIGSTQLPQRVAQRIMLSVERSWLTAMILENAVFFVLLFISIAYVVASSYNPFLYFRF